MIDYRNAADGMARQLLGPFGLAKSRGGKPIVDALLLEPQKRASNMAAAGREW